MRKASDILDFLRERPRSADAESSVLREEIETLVSALACHPQPRFDKLAAYRLLASNTLQVKAEDLTHWDKANAMMARELETNRPLDFSLIVAINATLLSNEGQLRNTEIFACGEKFLAASDIPSAIEILVSDILLESDLFVKAARVYSWIITAHPFVNGNGRTARLAADYVLLGAGYLPLCFHSPSQSHVGLMQTGPMRTPEQAYIKCLQAVRHAYRLVL